MKLSEEKKEYLVTRWPLWARKQQVPSESDWTTWLILGGRGAGKTRAGAEWVRAMALGDPLFTHQPVGRMALVGETYGDAREVMVEGTSGLLAIHPPRTRPTWTSSRRRLEWSNGAVAHVYSSEDPEALRGPQFGAAWCDELAKWKNPQETWDMLQFGLRLGEFPRQVVTTTPRPVPLLKALMADDRTTVTHMKTSDNRGNLAAGFFDRVVDRYQGTRLGRQELDGEMIDDRPDALWSRNLLEQNRLKDRPVLKRIVIAIDPPVTGTQKSDACGLIVAALGEDDRAYVLADETLRAVSPERWAKAAHTLYEKFGADRIVIETNQGGDMAETVLRQQAPHLPVRQVKASRGKYVRAEPVAHLYERGLVSHVGRMPDLEDEMCDFGLEGLSSGRSPDRLDALVWALTDLMLDAQATPRARRL
ncbi:MAG: terminase family protein [Pseudomonadota bacterium]